MQFDPRTFYTVAREISDPTDSATYYVQATIRNARTYDLLATLNLDNQGDHTFRKVYQLPEDSSGQGIQLLIKTVVYTDSGYTTISDNYNEELTTDILVKKASVYGGIGGGNGWGGEIDYKKIEKMIDTKISSIKFPEMKVNLSDIEKSLKSLAGDIKNINIPIPEKVDLNPLLAKIDENTATLGGAINSIHIPEQIPVDFTPVIQKIDAIEIPKPEITPKDLDDIKSYTKKYFQPIIDTVTDLSNLIAKVVGVAVDKRIVDLPKKEEQKKEELPDVSHLML